MAVLQWREGEGVGRRRGRPVRERGWGEGWGEKRKDAQRQRRANELTSRNLGEVNWSQHPFFPPTCGSLVLCPGSERTRSFTKLRPSKPVGGIVGKTFHDFYFKKKKTACCLSNYSYLITSWTILFPPLCLSTWLASSLSVCMILMNVTIE